MTSASSPIRHPNSGSRQVMTRRAWWLVVLNILLPGSAQVLAGSRGLGRFGLRASLSLLGLGVIAGIVYALNPEILLTVATNSIGLWILAIVMVFYALVWVVLTFDTIRLTRLVKARPKARPFIAGLATVVMVTVAGTASYGAYVATTASGFLSSVFAAGPSEPPVDGRYNIMLLGGDAGSDRLGMRPDSTSVVSIDAETGKADIIGIPRDLEYVPFPEDSPLYASYPDGYGYDGVCDVDVCQLNSIYTEVELKSPEMYPNAVAEGSEPGIEAMRDAASGVTGLTIQYYVLIDMQGFSQLIDALGGVDITVAERLPIGGQEDDLSDVEGWVEAGPQHMDGFTALWYGRARHGTSDYDRMSRQRVLQEAILQQFNPGNVLTKFQGVAQAGQEVVKTDVPQGMLGYFTRLAAKTKELPVGAVELVPANNVDPTDPDYDYIAGLIDAALNPVTETPAP
ncbi:MULTISPECIES: LCP family protein [Cryobacterium]|uniref:LytR family transcriptional regulator n=1 Tax=Cryobacterium zongtaii TaxID=1259217 RepID=A0A2S3ZCN6_9MICO|nr:MULTISPECIES: LCP family protein [Cryobacterium]ASD21189.1 transcriptional regulator [Cryobacterium sp. LW097]MEC5183126.1 LCP family protein required for cell wall assembly [Cryobacterium sp. MP_3.1]POH64115.1 LytR family transcriptional regulator [Cryobacterium zongtaii]POH69302.1 LytR family transcriptional regulator [Cryobacterium zongtaii]TFC41207.1 LytR family transcriptional regulator [Cryobacterium sp. TMN-39-2]